MALCWLSWTDTAQHIPLHCTVTATPDAILHAQTVSSFKEEPLLAYLASLTHSRRNAVDAIHVCKTEQKSPRKF